MGLSSFFKNLFGSAKESATDLAHQAETAFEQAKETASPYIDKAEAFAEDAIAKAKEASEPIIDSATEYASQAKDIVSEYVEKASDSFSAVIDSVKEKTSEFTGETKTTATKTMIDLSEEAQTTTEGIVDKTPDKK
jgi:vacuolar-type H+-ATPase subunit H